jgi:hypothetical protein
MKTALQDATFQLLCRNPHFVTLYKEHSLLISVGTKTRSLIRKLHFQGLRSQKKRSLTCVNEYFSGKRNEENGVFLQRLISKEHYSGF